MTPAYHRAKLCRTIDLRYRPCQSCITFKEPIVEVNEINQRNRTEKGRITVRPNRREGLIEPTAAQVCFRSGLMGFLHLHASWAENPWSRSWMFYTVAFRIHRDRPGSLWDQRRVVSFMAVPKGHLREFQREDEPWNRVEAG